MSPVGSPSKVFQIGAKFKFPPGTRGVDWVESKVELERANETYLKYDFTVSVDAA